MPTSPISVSFGIFCHNEEQNIAGAIDSVLASKTNIAHIKEIIVVSSGSYDRTNRIIRKYSDKDSRIKLIDEAERSGKSSAINLFLREAVGQVLISMSGDLRVKTDAIEEITLPFLNPHIGMVGAHPVPTNGKYSQVGQELCLMWELHHRISLIRPKCGEMVAFRNVIRQIPADSAVDEANLEVLLRMIGFTISYAPRSIVYNKIPRTLKDLLIQRRRVYTGHMWLEEKYKYQVVTMEQGPLLQVVRNYLQDHPNQLPIMIRLVGIEILARILGWFDYSVFGRNPYVWNMVKR